MKYHINFGSDYKLSFEILDNPVADAWVSIMQEKLKDEEATQKVFRSMFSKYGKHQAIGQNFTNLLYYYDEAQNYGLDLEFTINRDIDSYTSNEFNRLSKNVDYIYNKVVDHNFYYNADVRKNFFFKRCVKRVKRFTEQMLDSVFHTEESYCRIKRSNESGGDIKVTDDMRKQCFLETARPRIVLKACPNFDLKSLDILEKRDNTKLYNYAKNGFDHMHFITSEHKVSLYDEAQTQEQADIEMKERRNKMLDFVLKNNIDTNAGNLYHANYALPVIGHCINEQDFDTKDLQFMFLTYEKITSEFEE